MRIKKYMAATMPEALKLVKADLGPKAVILNTRTIKKSGGLGILAKGQIEVTAAIDEPAPGLGPGWTRNVLFFDGHVDNVPSKQIEEYLKKIIEGLNQDE